MKSKKIRIIDIPVIHDDKNHYFLNGDAGFRGILVSDLPRPKPPMNAVVDDMIAQQYPDGFYCDFCNGSLSSEQVDNGEIYCSCDCSESVLSN